MGMTIYQKFRELKINHEALSLQPYDMDETYFCTPKGARIIGWAGVDGVHYCFIRGFRDMVFAITPMNGPDYVHPIAKNFKDLLRLLLTCGCMDAVEQAYQMNEQQFEEYLQDNKPLQSQQEALDVIAEELKLKPMPDAYAYLKNLYREFDPASISYTKDFYDLDLNPDAPIPEEEYKVSYGSGFWGRQGRAGKEISVNQKFTWEGQPWTVLSYYICSRGLVLDLCMEAEPEKITEFIEKWNLLAGDDSATGRREQEKMEQEHPLNVEFTSELWVNGKELQSESGYGTVWIPPECMGDEQRNNMESQRTLEHYNLDSNRGFMFRRQEFRWSGKKTPAISEMKLVMKRDLVHMEGAVFGTPREESVLIEHPVTGEVYRLIVMSDEEQTLDEEMFGENEMEYPTHFHCMTYQLLPKLSQEQFLLRDASQGDRPRMRQENSDAAICIIGGSDGPTSVFVAAGGGNRMIQTVCSSLYFEPRESIEWEFLFCIKPAEDIEIRIL